jgi:excisionase family DNA binding protein
MLELLNAPEAANILRLQPSTIRAWILKRKLNHLKLGGRVLLRRSDLQDLLDRCLVPATTHALDGYKCTGISPPPGTHRGTRSFRGDVQ